LQGGQVVYETQTVTRPVAGQVVYDTGYSQAGGYTTVSGAGGYTAVSGAGYSGATGVRAGEWTEVPYGRSDVNRTVAGSESYKNGGETTLGDLVSGALNFTNKEK